MSAFAFDWKAADLILADMPGATQLVMFDGQRPKHGYFRFPDIPEPVMVRDTIGQPPALAVGYFGA